jgi:hypothetical protein
MTQARLIETVLSAPAERHAAIFRAATAEPGRPKMGTAKDAADILGVHFRTVKRYVKRGLLTERRLSQRLIRYDLSEVERLLAVPTVEAGGR